MSRERKFRAWDKDAHRMVQVTDITIDLRNDEVFLLWVKDAPDDNARTIYFDGFELMQFTGLHDSTPWEGLAADEQAAWLKAGRTAEEWKGREIYEGDIVTIWDYDWQGNLYGRWGVVEYNKGAYCVNLGTALHYFCLGLDEVDGYEVIGNIHENPELLEVLGDA